VAAENGWKGFEEEASAASQHCTRTSLRDAEKQYDHWNNQL